MQAEVHTLYQSDFFNVTDFRCFCVECSVSKLEQCKQFAICFVRTGYYEQEIFRKAQQMHSGRLLVSKPGIEYVVRHIDDHPDICTSFNFSDDFFERVKDYFKTETSWFFSNNDLQSVMLISHPPIEYLHQQILLKLKDGHSLEVDDLIVQLVEKVMHTMGNKPTIPVLTQTIKRHHLGTIEKARDYIFQHFEQNISLQQLADHCCVSVFHFSRLFKEVMHNSPYQYLTEMRLNHSWLLLQDTHQSVTEVAFQSGFNSLEHFTTTFKQRFKCSPQEARKGTKVTEGFLI